MVQHGLDSFFIKFKNLLKAEKDATLSLKSEAGRAFVSLSLDLGHVLSEQGQVPPGPRNGPARIRRHEKRAAAREKLAADEANKQVESTANVEETNSVDKPAAEEANGEVKSTDNVEQTRGEEPDADAEQVEEEEETNKTAEKDLDEEVTTEKVELDDEFCTDEVYNLKPKETQTVATQTLESGPLPSTPSSKHGFDYYSLRYTVKNKFAALDTYPDPSGFLS